MARVLVCILFSSLFLVAAGCPSTRGPSDDDDDDDAVDDDDDAVDDDDAGPSDVPSALTELSEGECPDLSTAGTNSFRSGGMTREVTVLFPDDKPEGMPVLFVWHGLGDTPANMINWLRLASFADDNDAIVVVPGSSGNFIIEWDYSGTGALDLALFDDMRTCVVDELGADVTRFSSTGFSAGAVWTSALSMHRSTSLATIMPMSGGLVTGLSYSTPDYTFPALVASGGAGVDTWGAGAFMTDFSEASDVFSEALRADDHLVVRCDHGGGHQPSQHAVAMLEDWVLTHRFGYPSPYADGDLRDLPDECFWEN